MIIFMASTSAKVSPFSTDSPSSLSHRTILPVTSLLNFGRIKGRGHEHRGPVDDNSETQWFLLPC